MKDYYRVLGVLDDAEDIIIRAAYRALAQRYHPDKWSGDKEQANKKMSEVNAAYEILSDPLSRKKYDEEYFKFRAKNESADINEDETSFVSEEDENWQMAIEFFPRIRDEFYELSKFSKILANTFKVALITSKDFNRSATLKDQLELEYFNRYYGDNEYVKAYSRNLLLQGEYKAAIELNKMVRFMGNSVDEKQILDQLRKKFSHLNARSLLGVAEYLSKLKTGNIKNDDILYLLSILSDEIKNSLVYDESLGLLYAFKIDYKLYHYNKRDVIQFLRSKEHIIKERLGKYL